MIASSWASVLILVTSFIALNSQGTLATPSGLHGLTFLGTVGSKRIYVVSETYMPWDYCKRNCTQLGMTPMAIESQAEHAFLKSQFGTSSRGYWTGGREVTTENRFIWGTNGKKVNATIGNFTINRHSESIAFVAGNAKGYWIARPTSPSDYYCLCELITKEKTEELMPQRTYEKIPVLNHKTSRINQLKNHPKPDFPNAATFLGTVGTKKFYLESTGEEGWFTAQGNCEKAGLTLAAIETEQENEFLRNSTGLSRARSYWTSGMQATTPWDFVWDHNNQTVNATIGEFEDTHNYLYLTFNQAQAQSWKAENFSRDYYAICQSDILLGEVGNKRFYFDNLSPRMNWTAARDYCASLGSGITLATIQTQIENNFLKNSTQLTIDERYWTAGIEVTNESQFKWNDTGSAISSGIANFTANLHDYSIVFQAGPQKGGWFHERIQNEHPCICQQLIGTPHQDQTEYKAPVTTTVEGVIDLPVPDHILEIANPLGFSYLGMIGNKRYYVENDITATWLDAKEQCERAAFKFATIKTKDENEFLMSASGLDATKSYWIGAQQRTRQNDFKWYTTGTPVTPGIGSFAADIRDNGILFSPGNSLSPWSHSNSSLTFPFLCELLV